MDGTELVTPTFEKLTLVTALVAGILALVRGWVYPRHVYKALEQDRDFYKTLSLRLLKVNERTIDVAEKVIRNGD